MPENNLPQGVLLAFDFGLKQIGLAVGQTLTGNARPLEIISAKDGVPRWEKIEEIIKEWQPVYVVVGLPLNMDGSVSEMALRAKKFANRLHGRFGVRVEMQDERLTSREAKQWLRSEGPSLSKDTERQIKQQQGKKPDYDRVDAVAAAIILQSWLETL